MFVLKVRVIRKLVFLPFSYTFDEFKCLLLWRSKNLGFDVNVVTDFELLAPFVRILVRLTVRMKKKQLCIGNKIINIDSGK